MTPTIDRLSSNLPIEYAYKYIYIYVNIIICIYIYLTIEIFTLYIRIYA